MHFFTTNNINQTPIHRLKIRKEEGICTQQYRSTVGETKKQSKIIEKMLLGFC